MTSNWRTFFEKHKEDNVMIHDYPECGPGSINVEEMYQAFKNRFQKELLDNLNEAFEEGY